MLRKLWHCFFITAMRGAEAESLVLRVFSCVVLVGVVVLSARGVVLPPKWGVQVMLKLLSIFP